MMILIAGAIGSPVAWDHYFVFAPLLIGSASRRAGTARSGAPPWSRRFLAIVPWFLFRTPLNNDWWASSYAFVARNALLLLQPLARRRRRRSRTPRVDTAPPAVASAHAATGLAAP